jgi:hypothetical protein
MRKTGITLRCMQLAFSAVMMGMAMASHAITLSGSTVSFTFDETALGLFQGSGPNGGATVSGDTLSFSPNAFVNSGNFIISQTINVLVTPNAGWQFSSLGFEESGLYSQNTTADDLVAVGGQLRIFDPLDFLNEVKPPIPNPAFLPTASNQAWSATINQNLVAYASAPSLNVTIENLLIAYPTAQISKNLAELTIITTPVPEVETWAMMLAGVGLIGLQLRRRKSSSARVIR